MCDQIKSKQRVADHGEVFTAEREVKAMCDLVKDEVAKIGSTVLEPACGEGNFLIEILNRKMTTVRKLYKKNPDAYNLNSVIAVSSLYGVDILRDNVGICRENLYNVWLTNYRSVRKAEPEEALQTAVRFILSLNIVCGNTLSTKLVDDETNDTDEPIVFPEWKFADDGMVTREDNRFDSMIEDNGPQQPMDIFTLLMSEADGWKRDPNTGKYLPKPYEPVFYKEIGNG